MDICAISATSVPCEWLFSAGGEIATDRQSRLGEDRFEQLQILKHTWQGQIIDTASFNSSEIEDVYLNDFRELFAQDQKLVEGSNDDTVGILQYKPIQSAKYCNLIGQLRATELDYIVKCPQCEEINNS